MVHYIALFIFIIFPALAILLLALDVLYFQPKWERDVNSIFKKWDETWDKYERGEITEKEYYDIVGRNKRKK